MRAVSTYRSAASTKYLLMIGFFLYGGRAATASRALTNSGRAWSMSGLKSAGATLPPSKSWALGRKTLMASLSGVKAASTFFWKSWAAFDAVTTVVLEEDDEEPLSPLWKEATRA